MRVLHTLGARNGPRPKAIVAHLRFYVPLVAACVAFLAVCELVLRLALPSEAPSTADYEMLEPDDVLGYRLAPSLDAVFQRTPANGGDRIRWGTNAGGFRGEELASTNAPRIVVYGDSNVQAVFSTDANTFPEQLESIVARDLGRPVEVVNAGVIGYGPDHYLLRMTAELPALQPALVVLTIFADNDLGDSLRHRLFELRDGRLSRRRDHFVYPASSLMDRARRFAASLLIAQAAKRAFSFVLPAPDVGSDSNDQPDTATRIRQLEELAALSFARYRTPGSPFLRGDYYDIDVAVAPESESARTKLSLLGAIFREAKATADRAGVALLVAIEPSRVDLTTLDSVNHVTLGQAYASYDPRRLTRSIEELCRSEAIDVINLYDAFSQNAPETLYFEGADDHWNDAGQNLAAETIAPRVVARMAEGLEARDSTAGN